MGRTNASRFQEITKILQWLRDKIETVYLKGHWPVDNYLTERFKIHWRHLLMDRYQACIGHNENFSRINFHQLLLFYFFVWFSRFYISGEDRLDKYEQEMLKDISGGVSSDENIMNDRAPRTKTTKFNYVNLLQ